MMKHSISHPERPLPKGLHVLTRAVRGLALFGAFSLVLVPPLFWLQPDWVRALAHQITELGTDVPLTFDAATRVAGLVACMPAMLLGLYALWQLWHLFGDYASGRFFAAPTQRRLRHFAWALAAVAFVAPLQRTLVGLAFTWSNPPGQRILSIGIGWNDYVALLMAIVLLAIATVQAEAARLAEENDGFV